MKKTLREVAKDRIIILDGAMGTMIQQYGLEEEDFRGYRYRKTPGMMKGNNDMLNITRPDVISDIHRKYLEAGADIITTNTFSSQRISQADYHLEDSARAMALEGARLARKAADEFSTEDRPRFVAGSVGPTNKTCSMSPDVSNPAARDLDYMTLYTDYVEQIEALEEGGADAILIETVFDTLNAKAAIDATMEVGRRTGPAYNAEHHRKRPCRTYSERTDTRRCAGECEQLPDFFHRTQLLVRCRPDEAFLKTAGSSCTLLYKCLSERRAAQ